MTIKQVKGRKVERGRFSGKEKAVAMAPPLLELGKRNDLLRAGLRCSVEDGRLCRKDGPKRKRQRQMYRGNSRRRV